MTQLNATEQLLADLDGELAKIPPSTDAPSATAAIARIVGLRSASLARITHTKPRPSDQFVASAGGRGRQTLR
jgi:hypothetical protein